jgi:hypothetical protein
MARPAAYALPCTGHSNTIDLHIETNRSIPHRTEQVGSGNALDLHLGGIVILVFRDSVIGNEIVCSIVQNPKIRDSLIRPSYSIICT